MLTESDHNHLLMHDKLLQPVLTLESLQKTRLNLKRYIEALTELNLPEVKQEKDCDKEPYEIIGMLEYHFS